MPVSARKAGWLNSLRPVCSVSKGRFVLQAVDDVVVVDRLLLPTSPFSRSLQLCLFFTQQTKDARVGVVDDLLGLLVHGLGRRFASRALARRARRPFGNARLAACRYVVGLIP